MKYLNLVVSLAILTISSYCMATDVITTTSRINIRGKNVFLSGMNVAWGNYANDVTDNPVDPKTFPKCINQISSAGGNAARWWLHTNGANGFTFDANHKITGISPQCVTNVKKVLDMAYSKGMALSLCLWSFDMMQNQEQDTLAMRKILEDTAYTNAYIKNGLIPLLQGVGKHPGIATWEILNEPDGMIAGGWSARKTTMQYVQQFTNLMAGAIHRNAPGIPVSSSFAYINNLSDITVAGFTNYYRDDRLIAAGGDSLGTLDIYQVHFYDVYFGNNYSPFHHPASYWQLDKPLIIGEFSAAGTQGKTSPHMSPTQTYQYAFDNGYAGCLSWAWAGYADDNLKAAGIVNSVVGFNVDSVAMKALYQGNKSQLIIPGDTNFYLQPVIVAQIPGFVRKYNGSAFDTTNYIDLKTIFYDIVDSTSLNFSITGYTNIALGTASIDDLGNLSLHINATTGAGYIYVLAQNHHGDTVTTKFKVRSIADNGNLAFLRPVTVSTVEDDNEAQYSGSYAVDGDTTTRWSSLYADSQYLYVDLGSSVVFNKVRIKWEAAFGKQYSIQYSNSKTFISNAISIANNTQSGWVTHSFDAKTGRYINLKCGTRGSQWGFSVIEFEVYNDGTTSVADPELEKSITAYPNPVTDVVTVSAKENADINGIQVTDVNGKIILNRSWNKRTANSIDLGAQPSGIYFIQLVTPKGVVSKKIVK